MCNNCYKPVSKCCQPSSSCSGDGNAALLLPLLLGAGVLLSGVGCVGTECCSGKSVFQDGNTTGVELTSNSSSTEVFNLVKVTLADLSGSTPVCEVSQCPSGLSGNIKITYLDENNCCKSYCSDITGYETNSTVIVFRVPCLPSPFPSGTWKSLCYNIKGPKKCSEGDSLIG